MRLTATIGCWVLMSSFSCASTTKVPPTSSRPGPPIEGQCGVIRRSNETEACFAVRCAEDFIRRNGYTSEPATGPLQTESFNSPTLERRTGTLVKAAAGYAPYPPGHLVPFRYTSGTTKTGRAVTMSATFDRMRVEHQDFILSAAREVPHCDATGGSG
jgi:hypothetical protein